MDEKWVEIGGKRAVALRFKLAIDGLRKSSPIFDFLLIG